MIATGGVEPPGEGQTGTPTQGHDILALLEDNDTVTHLDRRLKLASDPCRRVWTRAQTNHHFVSPEPGAQWDSKTWKQRRRQKQPAWTINDIALAMHALSGTEITGRFKRQFRGRPGEGPKVAEALNHIDEQIRELANAEHVESEAFLNLLIGAYAWLDWHQDYLVDHRGRTVVRSSDVWDMMWDPTSRQPMLADREWDAFGQWVSFDELLARYPGEETRKAIKDVLGKPDGWVREADQTDTARWPWLYRAENGKFADAQRRDAFLVDYQWRQREPLWVVERPVMMPNPEDPEGAPVPSGDTELVPMGEQEFLAAQDRAKFEKRDLDFVGPDDGLYRWRHHRSAMLGSLVLKEWGPEDDLGGFSRICMTGFPYRRMEAVEFRSPVDYMRDPQQFKNAVLSLMTSMLARQLKGGVVLDPDGFERPQDLDSDLAQPYPILRTKKGALKGGGKESILHELTVSSYPTGMDGFVNLADVAVWRPTGLNPDLLGQMRDMRRVSGVTASSVAEGGSKVMSWVFNSLKMMRQMSGRLQLAIFRSGAYSEKYLRELAGPRYAAHIPPKAQWKDFFDRQVIVDESAAQTRDQRLETWDLMSRTGEGMKMLEAGLMPPEIYAELFPAVTEDQRDRWLTHLAKRQEVSDLEQRVQVLTLQLQIKQIEQQMAAPPAAAGDGEAPPPAEVPQQ